MRSQTSAGAALAVLCLLLAMTSSGATTTKSGAPGRPHPLQRQRADSTPKPCQTNYPGGYSFNAISGAAEVAGGDDSAILGGYGNQVCDADNGIGAGYGNGIDTLGSGNAPYSFIGGGEYNLITATNAFVGSGIYNTAEATDAIVGGGESNSATAINAFVAAGNDNGANGSASFEGAGLGNSSAGINAFVGAGYGNLAQGTNSFAGAGYRNAADADDAFVGAGDANVIATSGTYSVIAGGYGNAMSGQKASLGGGEQNDVTGSFATIPGGYRDEALGNESFAAGSQAEARYTGSFVWSDYVSGEKPVGDSQAGEFVARASGGVYFFSNAAASAGVHLAAGSGTWSSLSDRNAKTGIVPLDDASILAKVAALPISAWQYKTERGVRHIGPMAQDFYAAFGAGEDDRHITSIDEDGIALAAIKAVEARSRMDERRKDDEIRLLRGQNARFQFKLDALEAKSSDLARQMQVIARQVREGAPLTPKR